MRGRGRHQPGSVPSPGANPAQSFGKRDPLLGTQRPIRAARNGKKSKAGPTSPPPPSRPCRQRQSRAHGKRSSLRPHRTPAMGLALHAAPQLSGSFGCQRVARRAAAVPGRWCAFIGAREHPRRRGIRAAVGPRFGGQHRSPEALPGPTLQGKLLFLCFSFFVFQLKQSRGLQQ